MPLEIRGSFAPFSSHSEKLPLLEYLKIGSNESQLFTVVRNILILTFLKTRYHVNITEGRTAENTSLGSALKFFFCYINFKRLKPLNLKISGNKTIQVEILKIL